MIEGSTTLTCFTPEQATIFQYLANHAIVQEHSKKFTDKLLCRLARQRHEPEAVDQERNGQFVRQGLRPALEEAIGKESIHISSFCGEVILNGRYCIARIVIPRLSLYGTAAYRGIFNTNPVDSDEDVKHFVVIPYTTGGYFINPAIVRGDTPHPAFELSEGEQLAVEAGLVFQSAIGSAECAEATLAEGRRDAWAANMKDLIGIVAYTYELIERLNVFEAGDNR
jgi:hypothetical protein